MKDKKKNITITLTLLFIVVVIIGVAYAYFVLTRTQTSTNIIGTLNCLDVSLDETSSAINLTNAIPVSDENGMKKTPYSIKITNNCNTYAKVNILVESIAPTSGTRLSDEFIKTNLSLKGNLNSETGILSEKSLMNIETGRSGYKLKEIIIDPSPNGVEEYELRLWLDADTTLEEGMNKVWNGKVVLVVEAIEQDLLPALYAKATEGSLLAAIKDNSNISQPLTVPGRENSLANLDNTSEITTNVGSTYRGYYWTYGEDIQQNADGTFNLVNPSTLLYSSNYQDLVGKYIISTNPYENCNNTNVQKTSTNLSNVIYVTDATSSSLTYKLANSLITEAVLANTEDDYGISHYYRGSVKNNYVEFANKCWRIIRVDGNGNIKLVLHNENVSGASKPCSVTNNETAAFAYFDNESEYFEDTAYYNNSDAAQYNAGVGLMYGSYGSTTFAAEHANINKNETLEYLIEWYNANMESYESKLADVDFCQDKTPISGDGIGKNATLYAASNRINGTSLPTLTCDNSNEVNRINSTNTGIKAGLITADEAAFAGMTLNNNLANNYLVENTMEENGYGYATMTPYQYLPEMETMSREVAWVYFINTQGNLITEVVNFMGGIDHHIRPVIALNFDTIVTGSGTSTDPYVVE